MGALWIVKGPSFLRRKTKTLIRLCGCAGGSEFSLYVHSNCWHLTSTISFVSLTHPAFSKLLSNVKCQVDLRTWVFSSRDSELYERVMTLD